MTRSHIATLCAVLATTGSSVLAAGASAGEPVTAAGAIQATLFTRPAELLGNVLRFRGALPRDMAGRTIQLQRQDATGRWLATARATVAADGRFIARWRTDAVGSFSVRAVLAGAAAQAASALPQTSVKVFRRAVATWYGPGFFGQRTACGVTLTRELQGVAHRTLPCGTPVELFYGGKTVTVPVVDRGPFGSHARYDLTAATAAAVGMAVTSTVGVAPRRGELMPIAAPVVGASASPTGGAVFAP